MTNKIQDQIEWCRNNGGFVGKDLADTMERMLAVVEAAREVKNVHGPVGDPLSQLYRALTALDKDE